MKITCNSINTEAKLSVKYLEMILDRNMRGDSMGGNIVKKVNTVLTFLYRKSSYLKFVNRKLLCSALPQSRFDYGFNIYYRGLYEEIKSKFQTAQNKMIRFISGYNSMQHLYIKDLVRALFLTVDKKV